MSSRALRKAQREREEQTRVADNESSEDEVTPHQTQKQSAFAMLQTFDEDDGEDHELDRVHDRDMDTEPKSSQATTKKAKKKKKKKKAASEFSAQTADDDTLDEIDVALRELAIKNSAATTAQTTAGTDHELKEACRLLAVDRDHLDVHNEMKKLFGRVAMDHETNAEGQAAARGGGLNRQQRRAHQQGRQTGAVSTSFRRNLFIQGKPDWPVRTAGGLSMEIVAKAGNGTTEYRFVHSEMYQKVQLQFEACVEAMDVESLYMLLEHNPYHVSTLLQVSEACKAQQNHTLSGELLERALFTMGRVVHSTFAKAVAGGQARLDFRRPENREFWLAGWRYMQNLGMRGTWRTVYEWAKLLLSLSPEEDPYALWLTLDQYALRSKQDLDYLNLSRNALLEVAHKDMPHVRFSQALAEYRSGNKSKGQQILFKAMTQFPWFVARLMKETDIVAPPAIWGKMAVTAKEQLWAELYAVRAKDIWITPENTALLLETASAVAPEAVPEVPIDAVITLEDARHTLLSGVPALIAMVPKLYNELYTHASDPLPPSDNIPSYASKIPITPRHGTTDEFHE